jgi:Aconitase X
VPAFFGNPAARLADAYVRMGCRPTFTCSPYLLDSAPQAGQFTHNYGHTKQGAYMCEADAKAAGDRAAKNEKHP